ncbi:MAG: hypothetical protein DRJ03_11685 [Chloroflexi bacterium]|nr:MAG: hypothetical protein DRJ03_11685 [Chloroflexota bacterium]
MTILVQAARRATRRAQATGTPLQAEAWAEFSAWVSIAESSPRGPLKRIATEIARDAARVALDS